MQSRRDEVSKDALVRCSRCGALVIATPEPHESRFAVRCTDPACGHVYTRAVRASALSLPGVLQISGTVFGAAAAYLGTRGLGTGLRCAAVLAALVAAWTISRFILRLAAHAVLQSSAAPGWKSEMIAYLAPAPSSRPMSKEGDDSSEASRGPAPQSQPSSPSAPGLGGPRTND